MSDFLKKFDEHPAISRVLSQLLEVWPEHLNYCKARFRDDPPGFLRRSNDFCFLVEKLAKDELPKYCKDYRWMCEEFLKEEIYFRRHGEYRLSTFQEAFDEVYGNAEYMSRYVHGILISQLVWTPHARAFDFYRTQFLPGNSEGNRHLEIGPGHGLFLYFASQDANIAELEAWDVSPSSIAATHKALKDLGVTREISIIEQDVLRAPERVEEFDSAIISEVLEHLERPDLALQTLNRALVPGGRLFINVPINSPAPDHIYLWRTIEEFTDFVKAQGFEIEAEQYLPVTGNSLEKAIKHNLSISCVLIVKKL